jgi:SM-20-related protein
VTTSLTLSEAEILALQEQGWFLRDGVLGHAAAMRVHEAIEALAVDGRLRPAGMSRGATHRIDAAVRGDAIAWMEPDEAPPELVALTMLFQSLRDALNREAYLGLGRIEIQIARYPGEGTRYGRHRDAFPTPSGGRPNRRITAIYYANPAWRPVDGGMLRLDAEGRHHDVAPVLDRLLVFLSERIEHEVLPARAPRRAVTAWFRAPDQLGG